MVEETSSRPHTILVVEDEFFIAADTVSWLEEAGLRVIGPFRSEVEAERALLEQRPDAALLDLNLGRGISFTLATLLRERCIPFFFATGYGSGTIPSSFRDVPRLEKPFSPEAIVAAVSMLMSSQVNV